MIERNLLDVKKHMNYERKLSKDDRDLLNSIKPLARFMTQEQFQDFFEGLILEKNMRQRLSQLNIYK